MRPALAIFLVGCGSDALLELPNPEMEHRAVVPVTVEPAAIEDAVIHSLFSTNPDPFQCCCTKFVDTQRLAVGIGEGPPGYGPVVHRTLIRIDAEAIPEGHISAWRMIITQESALSAGVVDIYRVTDGDLWTEDGADYFHKSHPSSWIGPGGGLQPGYDYDDNGNPPSFAYAPGEAIHAVGLPPEWLADWRDGVRANNGLFMRARTNLGTDRDLFTAWSSEGSQPLSFEIDIKE